MEVNNMPLIINQGKQDVSKDTNKFPPIVARNVLVTITQLKLADNIPDTLYVKMQVLEGEYKNRYIDDKITFDPQSPLSWKYRNVRKAVGVPYSETEGANVDIESILLNKALRVDLGVKEGVDKKTNEARTYQTINYKPLQDLTPQTSKAIETTKIVQPAASPTNPLLQPKPAIKSDDGDDLPW
jgi:hypothetical protein